MLRGTFAASHIKKISLLAGPAAENAANLPHADYSACEPMYAFLQVAAETADPGIRKLGI